MSYGHAEKIIPHVFLHYGYTAHKVCDNHVCDNRVCDNLPKTERDALRQLKRRHDIIIKSADKGSATVVMDRSWYMNECNRQLMPCLDLHGLPRCQSLPR